jgi:hypothetical protein
MDGSTLLEKNGEVLLFRSINACVYFDRDEMLDVINNRFNRTHRIAMESIYCRDI